jgi:hypothetical protein
MRHVWLDVLVVVIALPAGIFAVAFLAAVSDYAYSRISPTARFDIEV